LQKRKPTACVGVKKVYARERTSLGVDGQKAYGANPFQKEPGHLEKKSRERMWNPRLWFFGRQIGKAGGSSKKKKRGGVRSGRSGGRKKCTPKPKKPPTATPKTQPPTPPRALHEKN